MLDPSLLDKDTDNSISDEKKRKNAKIEEFEMDEDDGSDSLYYDAKCSVPSLSLCPAAAKVPIFPPYRSGRKEGRAHVMARFSLSLSLSFSVGRCIHSGDGTFQNSRTPSNRTF